MNREEILEILKNKMACKLYGLSEEERIAFIKYIEIFNAGVEYTDFEQFIMVSRFSKQIDDFVESIGGIDSLISGDDEEEIE